MPSCGPLPCVNTSSWAAATRASCNLIGQPSCFSCGSRQVCGRTTDIFKWRLRTTPSAITCWHSSPIPVGSAGSRSPSTSTCRSVRCCTSRAPRSGMCTFRPRPSSRCCASWRAAPRLRSPSSETRGDLVSIPLFKGGEITPSRELVQSASCGYPLTSQMIKEEFNLPPVLHLLLRCTQALITQMAQTAVCNRPHSIDQQLCRWLLLSLECTSRRTMHWATRRPEAAACPVPMRSPKPTRVCSSTGSSCVRLRTDAAVARPHAAIQGRRGIGRRNLLPSLIKARTCNSRKNHRPIKRLPFSTA